LQHQEKRRERDLKSWCIHEGSSKNVKSKNSFKEASTTLDSTGVREGSQTRLLALTKRIESLTRHQRPYVATIFQKLAAQHAANASIICDFIDA